jgi:hypothetical protein
MARRAGRRVADPRGGGDRARRGRAGPRLTAASPLTRRIGQSTAASAGQGRTAGGAAHEASSRGEAEGAWTAVPARGVEADLLAQRDGESLVGEALRRRRLGGSVTSNARRCEREANAPKYRLEADRRAFGAGRDPRPSRSRAPRGPRHLDPAESHLDPAGLPPPGPRADHQELGRRLAFCDSGDLSVSYMGYAAND